jgi:3-deoxy-D-manno-octulosonic-acid transferase
MKERTPRRLPVVRTFHRRIYDAIDNILTVAPKDVAAFNEFGLTRASVQAIGDTRFDQVCIRSAEARKHSIVPPAILQGKKVIVAGSSWPEDEEVLLPAFARLQAARRDLLLILAPHEPTIDHLEEIELELAGRTPAIRFSCLNEYRSEEVIIVDSIGILLTLYAYAHVAYVGGSFRQGVHNVLEAAVYGIPVIFGPRHHNSHEPLQLVNDGGGFVVNDSGELQATLSHLLADDRARHDAGGRAARFVQSNTGATGRFLEHLEPALRANGSTTGGSR